MKISIEEIQKMKVIELKAELAQRNLDQRGVKAILVDRLLDAMANEDKEEVGNGAALQTPLAPSQVQPQALETPPLNSRDASPKRSTRAQTQPLSPAKQAPPQSPTKIVPSESPIKPNATQLPTKTVTSESPIKTAAPQSPTKTAPLSSPTRNVTAATPLSLNKAATPASPTKTAPSQPLAKTSPLPSVTKPVPSEPPTKSAAPHSPTKAVPHQLSSPVKSTSETTVSAAVQSEAQPVVSPVKSNPSLADIPLKVETNQIPSKTQVDSNSTETPQMRGSQNVNAVLEGTNDFDSQSNAESKEAPSLSDLPKTEVAAESNNNVSSTLAEAVEPIKEVENTEQSIPSLEQKSAIEVPASEKVKESEEPEPMDVEENDNLKRKHTEKEGHEPAGRKFKKSRTEEDYKSRILPDDEPNQDETVVQLDWYKSDLNLKISKDGFLRAEPIVFDEFPWAYAGAKGTHGFISGKIAFQVKWLDNSEVKIDFGSVESKHVLRIGWSDVYSDLQLGESSFSYGYDSEGKLLNAGKVIDLENLSFEKGDVITSYLDMDSDPIQIMFAKNDVSLESKIEIPKTDIEGKILFPHILARNTSFEVNFGESETGFPLKDSFTFASKVEATDGNKVRGPKAPESKAECEFIMLCGLACCGKTRWAKEHKETNLEKHFQILGTSTVVERAVKKTTLGGPETPKVYDSFLMKAGKFVEKLVDMAPARRRNYILDQSNCQPIVQRRKAAGFEGFKRRAVIIFPNDDEYQKRIDAREQEQGKSVPKSTLLDMKATFSLPEVGEVFSEVEFPELKKEEAEELLKKYNKEGKDAGFGPRQQQRSMHGGRGRGNRGNFRGGRGGQRRGGPFPFRGGRSGPPPSRFPQGRFPIPPSRVPRDMGPGPGPFRRGLPPPRRGMPPPVPRRNEFPRGQSPWSRGGFPGGPPIRGSSGPQNRPPPPRPTFQNRGPGGPGGRFNPAPIHNYNPRAQTPQSIWNTTPPGSGNWGRQSGGNNPWVNSGAQVPDQGFGNWSQDNWVNGSGYSRNPSGNSGGGTWQGYGGQTYGSYGGGSGRR